MQWCHTHLNYRSDKSNLKRQLISSVLVHCGHTSLRGSQYLLFLDTDSFNCPGLDYSACWCETSWYASRTFFQCHSPSWRYLKDHWFISGSHVTFYCQGSDGLETCHSWGRWGILSHTCLLPQLLSRVFPPRKNLLVVGCSRNHMAGFSCHITVATSAFLPLCLPFWQEINIKTVDGAREIAQPVWEPEFSCEFHLCNPHQVRQSGSS